MEETKRPTGTELHEDVPSTAEDDVIELNEVVAEADEADDDPGDDLMGAIGIDLDSYEDSAAASPDPEPGAEAAPDTSVEHSYYDPPPVTASHNENPSAPAVNPRDIDAVGFSHKIATEVLRLVSDRLEDLIAQAVEHAVEKELERIRERGE